jgi:hypothetical protein
MGFAITQLRKISLLVKNNPEFEFIDRQLQGEIEKTLLHGTVNNLGEEVYRNVKMYTNEHLQKVLDDTVRLIASIQRLCIQNK